MMKNIFVALFTFLMVVPMMAQKSEIIKDEVGSDGYRQICCNLINTRSFTDKYVFNIGLYAIEKDGNVQKFFVVDVTSNTPYKVENNMALLIKTKDDEVIKLTTEVGGDASVRDIVKIANTYTHYYKTSCLYNISEEQIEKIKTGITKLRQETTTGYHEKEYTKAKDINKNSKIIIEQNNLINNALENHKTFESDF